MATTGAGTRLPRRKKTSPSSSTTSTVKSILFGIAVAYGTSYLAGTIQFMQDFVHDTGLLRGEIASLNSNGCTPVAFSSNQQSKEGKSDKEKAWLKGCEDVHVHQKSGLAFAPCAKDVESRKVWFPPAAKLNKEDLRLDGWLKDILVVYNIETETAQSMELVGFPTDVDRLFHGMDIFEDPITSASETKELALTLFVINHRRTGSVVEVKYTRNGDEKESGSLGVVRYVETIASDLIRMPNDVVAMGRRSFYVTNDHYYKQGLMRHIEGFGRRPWGNVVFYSPEATFIAYNSIASSNGITANPNRTLVYVSAFHGGTLDIFRPGYTDIPSASSEKKRTVEDINRLIFVESVKLDFSNDNVFYDALTDSLLIAGHSKVFELAAGFEEPEGASMQSASKVVQVTRNSGQQQPFQRSASAWFSLSRVRDQPKDRYLVKTVLEDSRKGVGGISTATTAALYRRRTGDGQ
ncbi:hypothetical protein BGZ47_009749, partial [Haplosporangium gracile]